MAEPPATDKLCFVIGPIGAPTTEERRHTDFLLNGIIRHVFQEHFGAFRVERADQIAGPGNINSQVINRLLDAKLVIGDMTFHNANAFYELAVRHMAGLPTIHMIRNDHEIPFDNASYRAIQFSVVNWSDIEAARAELKSAVEEVIKPGFQVENPVTNARGFIQLQKHATPEQRLLNEQLQEVLARLDRLESAKLNLLSTSGPVRTLGDAVRIAGTHPTFASVAPAPRALGYPPSATPFETPPEVTTKSE
jgi:hypothetical protein